MKTYIHNKLKIVMTIVMLSIASLSCEEEGDSFGISTVTYFPTFELTDGNRVVITTGSDFTPKAVVLEGENELTPDIENGVNNSVPGIYPVIYSAENSDGYSGSATQQVIVYNPAIVPTDVTGNIVDTNNSSRTGVITLVPGTTNIFHCTDMGFAGTFPLYFQMDGDVMTVIPQTLAFSATSVEASYDAVSEQFSVLIQPYGFAYTFQYQ